MAYLTDYAYYENSGVSPTTANHGSYQYVSLSDIVRDYKLMYTGDDSAVDNIPTWKIRGHAKDCIQKLNYDAFKLFKVLEEVIDSDLKMVLPHDYVDYIRLSIEKNGILFPLTENRYPLGATKYLVDANNDLDFDGSGYVQLGTSTLDTKRLAGDNELIEDDCNHYSIGAKFYLDPDDANINPRFVINRQTGVIDFNSEMNTETVVLEYLSDGMEAGDDTAVEIHKYFKEYIYRYITYEILNAKRGIPMYEIKEAKKRASASLKNAKIRMNRYDRQSLLMTLRYRGKWIK